ncbi:hypothetical protein DW322_03695 [Rhodococcus rhodnii]|uniref:amidase n=2 Tax=Rhodococcus rhodnii TaxID=38312 RepID=R7WMR2_9NOCA|nr:amidase family protein [Rhodococcus rhodnii]EOM76611.1 indoleacetamide hydrolase [Rhodococcus rhodnii LMG 5362]TXG89491.1 hypothetical protein DW322_03695 [Rhodococcus rhodnii]
MTGLGSPRTLAEFRSFAGTYGWDAVLGLLASRAADARFENALVTPLSRTARTSADAFPLVVKDNIDVAGAVTSAGTPALADNIVLSDAPVVSTLEEAGAAVVAKTNMHELAYGVTGANRHYGDVVDTRSRTLAGGSSSGTAAAVADGLAPVGLGTDTGGSVRIPAALCGLAGFRPGPGRYSTRGVLVISPTRDTVGVIAHTVADIATVDRILAPGRPRATGVKPDRIRLLCPLANWYRCAADVQNGLDTIRRALAQVVDIVDVDHIDGADGLLERAALPVPLYETPQALQRYLTEHRSSRSARDVLGALASADVAAVLEPLLTRSVVSMRAYDDALAHAARASAAAAEQLRRHGAFGFLTPTVPVVAVPSDTTHSLSIDGRDTDTFTALIADTARASVFGWPALSQPVEPERRCPSLQIDSPAGTDEALLTLGRSIERLLRGEGDRATLR